MSYKQHTRNNDLIISSSTVGLITSKKRRNNGQTPKEQLQINTGQQVLYNSFMNDGNLTSSAIVSMAAERNLKKAYQQKGSVATSQNLSRQLSTKNSKTKISGVLERAQSQIVQQKRNSQNHQANDMQMKSLNIHGQVDQEIQKLKQQKMKHYAQHNRTQSYANQTPNMSTQYPQQQHPNQYITDGDILSPETKSEAESFPIDMNINTNMKMARAKSSLGRQSPTTQFSNFMMNPSSFYRSGSQINLQRKSSQCQQYANSSIKSIEKIERIYSAKQKMSMVTNELYGNNKNRRNISISQGATRKMKVARNASPKQYVPTFHSNHIQNLTINAQPGFELSSIIDVNKDSILKPKSCNVTSPKMNIKQSDEYNDLKVININHNTPKQLLSASQVVFQNNMRKKHKQSSKIFQKSNIESKQNKPKRKINNLMEEEELEDMQLLEILKNNLKQIRKNGRVSPHYIQQQAVKQSIKQILKKRPNQIKTNLVENDVAFKIQNVGTASVMNQKQSILSYSQGNEEMDAHTQNEIKVKEFQVDTEINDLCPSFNDINDPNIAKLETGHFMNQNTPQSHLVQANAPMIDQKIAFSNVIFNNNNKTKGAKGSGQSSTIQDIRKSEIVDCFDNVKIIEYNKDPSEEALMITDNSNANTSPLLDGNVSKPSHFEITLTPYENTGKKYSTQPIRRIESSKSPTHKDSSMDKSYGESDDFQTNLLTMIDNATEKPKFKFQQKPKFKSQIDQTKNRQFEKLKGVQKDKEKSTISQYEQTYSTYQQNKLSEYTIFEQQQIWINYKSSGIIHIDNEIKESIRRNRTTTYLLKPIHPKQYMNDLKKLQIQYYEINHSKIKNVHQSKIEVDKDFKMEDQVNQLKRNSMKLINLKYMITMDKLFFMTHQELQTKDQQMQRRIQLSMIMSKIWASNRQHIKDKQIQKEIDLKAISQYEMYNDMVWKKKHDHSSFIFITDNSLYDQKLQCIDTFNETTSVFDIQSRVQEVFNYFDWDMIKQQYELFAKKIESEQHNTRYFNQINRLLNKTNLHVNKQDGEHKLFNKIDIRCSSHIYDQVKFQVSIPIIIRYKMGMCLRRIVKYSNENIFPIRFKNVYNKIIENNSDFDHTKQLTKSYDQQISIEPFGETFSAVFVNKNQYQNFNRIIFNENTSSVNQQLYNLNNDLLLKMYIEQLYTRLYKEIKQKLLGLTPKHNHFINKLQVCQQKVRAQSPRQNITQRQWELHSWINYRMFNQERNRDQLNFDDIHSYQDEEDTKHKNTSTNYVRKNAINKYSVPQCEHILDRYLQHQLTNIKDSKNLYYKRVEKILHNNEGYTDKHIQLINNFGYKTQLLRDPDNLNYVMEIYIPCLKAHCYTKIHKYCNQLRQIHKPNQLQVSAQKLNEKDTCGSNVHHNHNIKDAPTKKVDQKMSKSLKALQVNDFDTDRSMKKIEFTDICEDYQSDSSEEKPTNSIMSGRGFTKQTSAPNTCNGHTNKNQKIMDDEKAINIQLITQTKGPSSIYKKQLLQNISNNKESVSSVQQSLKFQDEDIRSLQPIARQEYYEVQNTQQQKELDQEYELIMKNELFKINAYIHEGIHQVKNDNEIMIEIQNQKLQYFYKLKQQCQNQKDYLDELSSEHCQSCCNSCPSIESIDEDLNQKIVPLEESIIEDSSPSPIRRITPNFGEKIRLNKKNLEEVENIISQEQLLLSNINNQLSQNHAPSKEEQLKIHNEIKILKQLKIHKERVQQKQERLRHQKEELFKQYLQMSNNNTCCNGAHTKKAGLYKKRDNQKIKNKLNIVTKDLGFSIDLELPSDREETYIKDDDSCETAAASIKLEKMYRKQILVAIELNQERKVSDILNRFLFQNKELIEDQKGNNIVHMAVKTGNINILKTIINHQFNINHRNHDGNTPLHFACAMKNVLVIDTLINHQVNETIQNNIGLFAWQY